MADKESRYGFKIDPDAHYTTTDVSLGLGVNVFAQEEERKAGRLQGIDRAGSVIYSGAQLLAWLKRSGQL